MKTGKTLFALSGLILVLLAAPSCHKALPEVEQYFPELKTVTATVQTDGTVLVRGEVVSEGNASVEYLGFCCGTMSNPELLNRQLISTDFDGTYFTAVYSGFSVDSTYYFRSWGTNDYGWVYGNVISLDSIIAIPVSAPCTLTMNSVNIGGSTPTETYYDVSQPTVYMGVWEFDATANSITTHFKFGSTITTGIYTTTTSTNPGSGQVYVQFTNGSIGGVLNSGSNVYVNTISSGVYEVAICSSPWLYNSTTLNFKTKLTVPY